VLKKISRASFFTPARFTMAGSSTRITADMASNMLGEWDSASNNSSLLDGDGSGSDWTVEEGSDAGSISSENESTNLSNNCNTPISNAVPSTSTVPTVSRVGRKRQRTGAAERSVSPSADWVDITGSEQDSGSCDFQFSARKAPGVQPHVDLTNELSSLEQLLTSDVLHHIVDMVNDYAAVKLAKNRPARRRSVIITGIL
jgi:hypothetical protein